MSLKTSPQINRTDDGIGTALYNGHVVTVSKTQMRRRRLKSAPVTEGADVTIPDRHSHKHVIDIIFIGGLLGALSIIASIIF